MASKCSGGILLEFEKCSHSESALLSNDALKYTRRPSSLHREHGAVWAASQIDSGVRRPMHIWKYVDNLGCPSSRLAGSAPPSPMCAPSRRPLVGGPGSSHTASSGPGADRLVADGGRRHGAPGDLDPDRPAAPVLYVATFAEAIYVLHGFEKKTQQTVQRDLDLARQRLAELTRRRRSR
jgi:hypothetical protein